MGTSAEYTPLGLIFEQINMGLSNLQSTDSLRNFQTTLYV